MSKVHLFNPENDLALAADEPHFTPPAAALRLRRAGALLPSWLADAGDSVIDPEPCAADDAAWLSHRFGIDVAPVAAVCAEPGACSPWGWSADARRQFINAGVQACRLPDDVTLQTYRALSSRATASQLTAMIADCAPDGVLAVPAAVARCVDDAMRVIAGHDGRCYIKSPWSSSGRGVFPAANMSPATLRRQISGIIARQGFVTIEPAWDRVLDFAMLFTCSDGAAAFDGLSVFHTAGRCAYTGNVVAPQARLNDIIASHVGEELPVMVRSLVASALGRCVASRYDGRVGVDMMVVRKDDALKIVPCVEINLRHTMGMVAMAVAERLSVAHDALFSIGPAGASASGGIDLIPPSQGLRFVLNQNVLSTS